MRLAYWQIWAADSLRQQAASQRLAVQEVPGQRGMILAADGFPLAANMPNYLLFANPQLADGSDRWSKLESLLPASDAANLTAKLAWKQLAWVSLSDQINPATKALIAKLNLPGIGFNPLSLRFYPEGSSSAQLLGFVGKNASGLPTGYFGLEGYYERKLSGRPGKIVMERDALGRPIVISGQDLFPAVNGSDIHTSIDRTLQFMIAAKLVKGLAKYGASAGTITVMDPTTGRLLAMVSWPNYDPSQYQLADSSLFKNPVVAESYEPGSTFKVMVMSAALDAGAVQPDTKCDICSGPFKIAEYVIRTWNDKYYPGSSMSDVIVHSDNIGMVFVARRLGVTKFVHYLHQFGLGQPTGIDLQDESSPQLRPDNQWGTVDLVTAAFGQGIAMTPIQMLTAVAAIANGGKLPSPQVAGEAGSTKRVVSTVAAAQMTQMMIKAVEEGEAKWTKIAGYTVAGKTGTAQIPVAGHYDNTKTIVSFVGFAPASAPKFVMLVTLREPQTSPWGSETAAPLWFDVARDLFRYLHISPDRAS